MRFVYCPGQDPVLARGWYKIFHKLSGLSYRKPGDVCALDLDAIPDTTT